MRKLGAHELNTLELSVVIDLTFLLQEGYYVG